MNEERHATFDSFLSLDIRVGIIRKAEVFEEAKKPAYKLRIFFGDEIGFKNSSAQIRNYSVNELEGRRVIAVINFPPKQVANFISEVLVLGAVTEEGIQLLMVSDRAKPGDKVA